MCLLFLLSAALGVWTGSTQRAAFGSQLSSATWAWQNVGAGAEALRGAEPGHSEEEAAHNTQLCKQVLPKQPYRSDATLHNIVTNPRLRAVSCLSPPCEACRRGGCCQRGDGARRPCRRAGGQKLCVSAPLSRGG